LRSTATEAILARVMEGRRLSPDEAVALLESHDLTALGRAADAVCRRLHPEPYRTYAIDRNINYTNICTSGCRFCAFSRPPGHPDGYVITEQELAQKIAETLALGGTQILLQGGMHPELELDWFESLFRQIKSRFTGILLHALSPPEVRFLAGQEGLSVQEVLTRLREAGLDTIPGGGAEILVDRVRRQISPAKGTAEEWLEVMRVWHRMGGHSSVTMMFGHVETLADRVEHLDRVRRVQEETGGFKAFICWTFQPEHTDLGQQVDAVGAFEYLKTLAVARLFLDNVPNVQASWVTQGEKVGQLCLAFGANDMGGLMIEENVVAAAGTVYSMSLERLRALIRGAGYDPRQRDALYRLVGDEG